MPPLSLGLLLLLSLPTVFFALVLSPQLRLSIQSLIPLRPGTKNPALRPDQPDVYCYGSIITVDDDDHEFAPGCLSVNADGTFEDVFSPEQDGMPITEEEMANRGWEVDFGSHVVPGLWDGHAHLLQYGEMLRNVKLSDATSLEEVHKRIHDHRARHRDVGTRGNWIKGMGWDQALLTPGRMPSASDLPDNLYVLLYRVDVHCIWVSMPVLSLLPTFPRPPVAPPGGTIPSPGVFCDNAMDLVLPFLPAPSAAQKREYVLTAQSSLHRYGIVGLHDAGVRAADRELYSRLASRGQLKLRINAMVECTARNTFCPAEAAMVARPDGLLTVHSVKLFADGALGSWGAALLEPYSDDSTTSGTLLIEPAKLTNLTRRWAEAGYQVCIHAIGDAASRAAIDAFAAAATAAAATASSVSSKSKSRSKSKLSFRLEHAQVVAPVDQARMRTLGIVPSVQPTHATSDSAYALSRLGDRRLRDSAYRLRSFLPLGLVLGSDFPVEPPSVLAGIYAAVTRRDPRPGMGKQPSGQSGKGWYTGETLTVKQALWGFTRSPANAAGLAKAGAIMAGTWADWVVLDRRLADVGAGEDGGLEWMRSDTAVRETWLHGKRVFMRHRE